MWSHYFFNARKNIPHKTSIILRPVICSCSVAKLCLTLCNPMDCNMPGFPVLHYFLELAQIHVHWGSDVTQSSHALPPPFILPSTLPSIRVFSSELALRIRCPNYWSFSFSISPSNKYSGLISLRMDWLDLLAVQGTLKSLLQHHNLKHPFFGTQPALWSNSHICIWSLEKLWLYRPLLAK